MGIGNLLDKAKDKTSKAAASVKEKTQKAKA